MMLSKRMREKINNKLYYAATYVKLCHTANGYY